MAEAKKASEAKKQDIAPTKRVVLRKVLALAVPSGATTEQLIAAHKALGGKGAPAEIDVWQECGEFEGSSKDRAIELFAGKPGTPDAKPGTYKAPGASAFAGGMRLTAPPKPLVEKESID